MRNNYYDDQNDERRSRRGYSQEQWDDQGRYRNRNDWDGDRESYYGGRDRMDMDYGRDAYGERYQDSNRRSGRSWSDFGGRSDSDERSWNDKYRYGSGMNGDRYEDDDNYTNRNTGGFGGSGRGWYGDSGRHSDAAERGWENRRGERNYSSSERDRDDDRRTGRGRGWFGDSDSSERGWYNRR